MEKRESPEEIRAERIANLKDPEAIAAIKTIEEERKEKLAELRQTQRDNLDRHVEEIARQREQRLNGPQLTPPGMKDDPVIDKDDKQRVRDDAKAEVYRQYKMQDQARNLAFDRRVDRELDAADRRLGREPSHTLDRSDR